MEPEERLTELEKEFDLKFNDRELLFRSLVHDSYVYENDEIKRSNERLEFLGDSVIGLVVSNIIFEKFPGWREGDLAIFKSRLVSADSLANLARKIDLGRFIFLGRGEEASGGRLRTSILSDSLEAFIGAIYIDQGYDRVFRFVSELMQESLEEGGPVKDYKSYLQEYSQREFKTLPNYTITGEEGPPHRKTFRVRVSLADNVHGEGEGTSKKNAEQDAARDLIDKLPESEMQNLMALPGDSPAEKEESVEGSAAFRPPTQLW